MSQAEAIERQQDERERQRDFQREQQHLQAAFNADGDLDRGWLREVLDTDDLEEYLDEYELRKVRGLLNRQWVLANLSAAQVHDRWYKLEVQKYKILGSFPPSESSIQGPIRAFLFADETEMLSALSPEQRNAIDQIITTLQNMVTRSEGGFERKQMNTNIARSESLNEDDGDESGGTLGLFS